MLGALNMLGLAKRVRARFLVTSTSEIYGDPEVHPQTEGYWGHVNCIGPRACYDEGKRISETLCYEYHKLGVSVRIARIFNTFGAFAWREQRGEGGRAQQPPAGRLAGAPQLSSDSRPLPLPPQARAWTPTTGASCPTSSSRRCRASR